MTEKILYVYWEADRLVGEFYELPQFVVKNERDRRMVLTAMMCKGGISWFCDIVATLLEGKRISSYNLPVELC
jgi:hypothetical protein